MKKKFNNSKIKKEIDHIIWPDRNTVISGSLVILSITAFFLIFISGLDFGFSRLVNEIKGN